MTHKHKSKSRQPCRRADESLWVGLKLMIAALIMAVMVSPATAKQQPSFENISISSSRGGQLYTFARDVSLAKRYKKNVSISNYCQSACTLYLSLPPEQLCIKVGTKFSFHRAYGSSRSANEIGSKYLMKKYPKWVRTWIRQNGGLSNRLISMPYAYAAEYIPTCKTKSVHRKIRQNSAPNSAKIEPNARRAVVAQVKGQKIAPGRRAGGER